VTLITDTWVAIPSCVLMLATHTASLVSIGQSKLKLLSGNGISIFSNSDLDHRHLGSNPKLPLDISYLYSKFGVNRPKQTKVIERKPNVNSRPPAADFSITITRFSLKTWLIKLNNAILKNVFNISHFNKINLSLPLPNIGHCRVSMLDPGICPV